MARAPRNPAVPSNSLLLFVGVVVGIITMVVLHQIRDARVQAESQRYTELLWNVNTTPDALREAARKLTEIPHQISLFEILTTPEGAQQVITMVGTYGIVLTWFLRERFHFLNYQTMVDSVQEAKKSPAFQEAFTQASGVIREVQARRKVVEGIVKSAKRKAGN